MWVLVACRVPPAWQVLVCEMRLPTLPFLPCCRPPFLGTGVCAGNLPGWGRGSQNCQGSWCCLCRGGICLSKRMWRSDALLACSWRCSCSASRIRSGSFVYMSSKGFKWFGLWGIAVCPWSVWTKCQSPPKPCVPHVFQPQTCSQFIFQWYCVQWMPVLAVQRQLRMCSQSMLCYCDAPLCFRALKQKGLSCTAAWTWVDLCGMVILNEPVLTELYLV